ncbi:FadR/GntR family transcriptional regulator [Corallococcus carmarthensis]|uniref:FadR/GntR family transcriptional regulator n=1 Tax=Corallococcus carmarthensis TaxID=2316728 RepID=UPI00148BE7E6|nr:GntR family transcriptional regulator [Corallococcus carmarthensis]NOK16569.1 FadR family transcriptional regulator [Corallococcus carmarthensis]
MVRVGLVAYVEEQLERDIWRGRLPRSGQLGSEKVLARNYGVSRGTVREALRRLAARGLVVQRSGRRTRAVSLDESLTLENLGLALHDERSEECRRLLEGFFCLKRQVLVELLADCCERASSVDLRLLEDACFRLWDAAKWHPGARCAQLEFELLRLAARVAERPGHLLLIQSLQRALRGNAVRLLSFMGGESLRQWATCAMNALSERDTQALQLQLPALLKACDARMLDDFAPAPQEHASPEAPCAQEGLLGDSTSATGQDDALEARPFVEECGPDGLAPAAEALGVAPVPHAQLLPVEPDSAALLSQATLGLNPSEPGGECTGGAVTGTALGDLFDHRTGRDASSPEGDLRRESPPSRGHPCGAGGSEGGPLNHSQDPTPPTTKPVSRAPLDPAGPTTT